MAQPTGFSSAAMRGLNIPISQVSKKVPNDKETGDMAVDFMKQQQKVALCETIDMMQSHAHIRQAVRDYAHGLLSAAVAQKEAIVEDLFATTPTTLGKLEEDFVLGWIAKNTELSANDLSKCRAFDSKFTHKLFLLMVHAMAGTKVPESCRSKRVLARALDMRLHQLGAPFELLKVDNKDIMQSGKVNWARLGIFKVTTNDKNIITDFTHLFSGEKCNVEKEGISDDFTFEGNWNARAATLIKSSRKHLVWELFSKAQQLKMAPWTGSCKSLCENAEQSVVYFKGLAEDDIKVIGKDDYMKETNQKRSFAIKAAREKLELARAEAQKKRRISVADAKQ